MPDNLQSMFLTEIHNYTLKEISILDPNKSMSAIKYTHKHYQ